MKKWIVLLLAACLVVLTAYERGLFGEETPEDTLYVLMYHEVVPDGQPCGDWTVTAGRFREDLQWLADNGYRVVSVEELASGGPLPERAALITFDDGYRSNYELAYPILKEYGMSAVISVIGYRLDEGNPWFLTWDMCREMQESGLIEIGSHTYDLHATARCIQRLKDETQSQYETRVFPDVEKSIDRIETELGVPVQFFAYPNGLYDTWSDDFMAQRFKVTVSSDFGAADLSRGLYKLPRYNINMAQPPARYLPALDGEGKKENTV